MNDLRKAAEQALEALRYTTDHLPAKTGVEREVDEAITALQVALAHEALDRMAAENQRLGLYNDKPPVKSYAGGKPNYCTKEEST